MSGPRWGAGIVLACGIFLISVRASAQQTTASLLGNVSDSTGAVVAGVTIQVTNLSTNIKREASTDSAGTYSIPYLPAGSYRITVTHQGFQTQSADNVTLQVDQTARIDFTLKVGDVSESINVNAAAALLQTENASVGTVIDAGKIVDLPLNGRNFIQLAQLVPACRRERRARLPFDAGGVPWASQIQLTGQPRLRRTDLAIQRTGSISMESRRWITTR
jgi:hypothetical protein